MNFYWGLGVGIPIGVSMGLVLALMLQIRAEVREKMDALRAKEEEDEGGSRTDDK